MIYPTPSTIKTSTVQMICYFVFLNKQKILLKMYLEIIKKEDWAVKYLPHGIDKNKFFPVTNDFNFEAFKEQMLGKEEQDFVVLWNSRNIRRKKMPQI